MLEHFDRMNHVGHPVVFFSGVPHPHLLGVRVPDALLLRVHAGGLRGETPKQITPCYDLSSNPSARTAAMDLSGDS